MFHSKSHHLYQIKSRERGSRGFCNGGKVCYILAACPPYSVNRTDPDCSSFLLLLYLFIFPFTPTIYFFFHLPLNFSLCVLISSFSSLSLFIKTRIFSSSLRVPTEYFKNQVCSHIPHQMHSNGKLNSTLFLLIFSYMYIGGGNWPRKFPGEGASPEYASAEARCE